MPASCRDLAACLSTWIRVTERERAYEDAAPVMVQVKQWRRYGNDRLYVTDFDGAKIGWWNLADDTGHPEAPGNAPLLIEAVMD